MQHTHPKQKKTYGFWNWGTGIALVIIAAALAMSFLVYKSMMVRFDLVEEDYYSAELKQNDKTKAINNVYRLSAPPEVKMFADEINVRFPQELIGKNLNGNIKFYRPSDINLDIRIPIHLNDQGWMVISKAQFKSGTYRLQINWTVEQEDFYYEESVYIP